MSERTPKCEQQHQQHHETLLQRDESALQSRPVDGEGTRHRNGKAGSRPREQRELDAGVPAGGWLLSCGGIYPQVS